MPQGVAKGFGYALVIADASRGLRKSVRLATKRESYYHQRRSRN